MSTEPNHCTPLDLNKVASMCNAAQIQFHGKTVEFYAGYVMGVPQAYCAEYGCTLPIPAHGSVLLNSVHKQLSVFWIPAHQVRMSDPVRPQQLLTMIPRLQQTPQSLLDDARLRDKAAARKTSPTNPTLDAFLAVRSFMQDADKEALLNPMPITDLLVKRSADTTEIKQGLSYLHTNQTIVHGSWPPDY